MKKIITLALVLSLFLNFNATAIETIDITINYKTGATTEISVAVGDGSHDYITFNTATGSVTGANEYIEIATIPDTIEGVIVTTIAANAFSSCSYLKAVYFPETLTTIGSLAFSNCSSLTTVNIPASVQTISQNAFELCTYLINITVAESNAYFKSQDGVLYNNSMTTLLQYPIGNPRTSFSIPDGVTTISTSAFKRSSYLKSISIPSSVTNISDYAFAECYDLLSVTIPNSVTTMGEYAFANCSKLESVTLSTLLKTIPVGAFGSCTNLKSVSVPSSVTTIDIYAFKQCESLENVSLTNSLENVNTSAFSDCINLTNIYFKGSQSDWDAISVASDNLSLSTSTKYFTVITQQTETTPEPTPEDLDEEILDEEELDEEILDEEVLDEENLDEEVLDEENLDEEVLDEEILDEEVLDEEILDEEVLDEEILDEEENNGYVPKFPLEELFPQNDGSGDGNSTQSPPTLFKSIGAIIIFISIVVCAVLIGIIVIMNDDETTKKPKKLSKKQIRKAEKEDRRLMKIMMEVNASDTKILAKVCNKCGHLLPVEQQYCEGCGKKLKY